ncbi:ssDNA binding protein [Gordonia phage DalanDe]|nr:ssDNA binding protein [Gordonia phage DalanDe]
MAVKVKAKRVGSLKKLKEATKRSTASLIKNVGADEPLVVRFLEEPGEWIEYEEYYSEDTEPRFFPAIEGMDPDFVAELKKPSKRFLANAVDVSDNQVIALKLPTSLASTLEKFASKYGTVTDRDYELSREGTKFDTQYSAMPEPPSRMNLRRFKALDLIDILGQQVPKELRDEDDDDLDDDDPPFDVDDDDDDEPIRRRPKPKSRTGSRTATKKRPIKKKPLGRR